ncbi:MAG: hypothetical protein JJU11_04250 [Candidatus Sumerlaeia bacterium]|nr:hypothetical protein [Candidatus Sumerlaeia bacterium]
MKKFSFQAVDTEGRIIRGVLKAESSDHARELLFDNQVHPKQLDETDGETKVTWAPKPTRREDNPASHFYKGTNTVESPVRETFSARLVTREKAPVPGTAGLTRSSGFAFQSEVDEGASMTIAREDIEIARIEGFFPRMLRIFRLNGRMEEFAIGGMFAPASAKETMRTLNKK